MLDKNNDLIKWYVHCNIQISEYDIVTWYIVAWNNNATNFQYTRPLTD